jgi:hypothetical protein
MRVEIDSMVRRIIKNKKEKESKYRLIGEPSERRLSSWVRRALLGLLLKIRYLLFAM